jgi:hypothetical protein
MEPAIICRSTVSLSLRLFVRNCRGEQLIEPELFDPA